MDAIQARTSSWVGAVAYGTPFSTWSGREADSSSRAPARVFHLSAEEGARFLRIVAECGRIRRHCDIHRWLSAEVQHFLPHEMLLSAWGDFESWDLKLDLISGLPGVRTSRLVNCRLEPLIREAYARWCDAGRDPVVMDLADIGAEHEQCGCPVHGALRRMRQVIVHGVHDKRSGSNALYIALASEPLAKGCNQERFLSMLDPLVAQIDSAFRRVPAFPLPETRTAAPDSSGEALELSAREIEVLEALRRGKTNLGIAAALDISPFTVKNHVQRIFRKIGVRNRTQAAARYAEVLRPAAPPQNAAAAASSF